ncbi:exo1-exonuclease which interacts with msh2p [Malassezia pachydermatis]|uniref:Exo1-exonuclease which interacts with msh2p n=1 Tax=Malassezia pachydermatis TaxID=77020 RepID=A0A0M9VQ36_9BASI|nr:exo1-exonuclease which interacts with msh2p [Malassezia pachydermatis]KOS15099.1 exo1-exonuclease which interacts with msh2p [Malassezia pachydermatis]
MGIAGLLPLLKDIQRDSHVEAYRGKTLGIDAYVWLHRGAYACATELALGKPTTRYITYAMHRIKMLQHYGVRPYVVFDGGHLPSKAGTEAERAARRKDHRARGMELHAKHQNAAAREAFVRSVDVTPQMAYELIKQLKAHGISYIVAPYEADAQLAYLEQEGLIDGIITEDSDLLVFGCKTVLFKLDTYGHCVEIHRDRFAAAKQINLAGWTDKAFRQMAILSGCDYLPSIVGMGLKNAHRLLRKYDSIHQVLRALRLEGKMTVPPSYAEDFERAEFTFAHQRVWDPRGEGSMTTLTPLPSEAAKEHIAYIGAPLTWDQARAIAHGEWCPITQRPFAASAASWQAPTLATPSQPRAAQPTLNAFFRRTPSVPRSTTITTAVVTPVPRGLQETESSCSTAESLFDTTVEKRESTPCTSPVSGIDEDEAAHTKPSSPPSPLSSPLCARHSDVDAGISSPTSSPVASPPRKPPLTSTPCVRRTPSAPVTPGLTWTTSAAAYSASGEEASDNDDMARRAAWFQRFRFSGARARHVVLPGTSPSPSPSTDPRPTPPRLPLGKRAVPETPGTPGTYAKRRAMSDTPLRTDATTPSSGI